MSRVISITRAEIRMKKYFWVLILLVGIVSMNVYAVPSVERHTLIIANEDMGAYLHVLELLPTGEIVTTEQSINLGVSAAESIGVSPDSRFVWTETYGRCKQFAITPYGQLTETGRFIEGGAPNIKFTPNGQMLFLSGPIYRAYPDGSVESTANFHTTGGHISPRGDIDLGFPPNNLIVFKIDYDTFSIYSIQYVRLDNIDVIASAYDAVYTPEGDYASIIYRAGLSGKDVAIFPVQNDGSLDTTQVQRFDMGTNAHSGAISKDGNYIYVGYDDQAHIGIIRQNVHGSFEDTGWRLPITYWPWQMIVSPDGKYLIANGHGILESFAIQDDGNLVSVYQFPFSTIFGKDPIYFQFAYPEAPTEVDFQQWQLYR